MSLRLGIDVYDVDVSAGSAQEGDVMPPCDALLFETLLADGRFAVPGASEHGTFFFMLHFAYEFRAGHPAAELVRGFLLPAMYACFTVRHLEFLLSTNLTEPYSLCSRA